MTDPDDEIPIDHAHAEPAPPPAPKPRKDGRLLETRATYDWCGCTGGDETKWRNP